MHSVSFFVGSEVAGLSEALLTVRKGALVRLFACVSSQVCPQVEIKGEGLPTELTSERLFPLRSLYSVHQHVSTELGVVKELLAAALDRTGELSFSVCHGMLAQRPCISEDLPTPHNVARVSLFLCIVLTVLTRLDSLLGTADHCLAQRRCPVLVCTFPQNCLIVRGLLRQAL